MSIIDEFEKAFADWKNDWDKRGDYPTTEECALWAAKWALDKAAEVAESDLQGRAHEIRSLAKEFSR